MAAMQLHVQGDVPRQEGFKPSHYSRYHGSYCCICDALCICRQLCTAYVAQCLGSFQGLRSDGCPAGSRVATALSPASCDL